LSLTEEAAGRFAALILSNCIRINLLFPSIRVQKSIL